uniref:HECT-type E3 ubiquitin transferase n=1 Tax=Clastoptera arizonana TaxID=38151 RepID=A0A1B6DRZ8_9HEMI
MKIDRTRIKKSTSEVPPECQALIDRLRSCNHDELLGELRSIETWTYGKCELYHWIDILDICDSILELAASKVFVKGWKITCDLPHGDLKELLLWVLHFTTLLIEHSFSRHLYNSMEHLLTLMSSCDLDVVLGVLHLLYMFSKRSNFLTRLLPEMRAALLTCLTYLAESWGGKEHGFGLADCCRNDQNFTPQSATTLHYEFYSEDANEGSSSQLSCIHLEHIDKIGKSPAEIMDSLIESYNVPKDGQMLLFTHVRLAFSFSKYSLRLKCVTARLRALSVLLYSNSYTDSSAILYPGILDELVELLELKDPGLDEIHSAALRTLTSIIHLDRSPHMQTKKPGSRLCSIIDVTGASLYHGFLPQLVRNCIKSLTSGQEACTSYPVPLATALFSFLYHLASYEQGGEALVSCGMMECLLRVINWNGRELEHITFVTRAVRVIDLITNIDMQGFQSHNGLASFINRLDMEISICRSEQPFVIETASTNEETSSHMELDVEVQNEENEAMQVANSEIESGSTAKPSTSSVVASNVRSMPTCLLQRAALLKSMLNFLKKTLQDPAFSESIRNVMDGSLPSTLKHIVSNPEYYGPSLFLLATDVVAVYVFQEPSLLSHLQDIGLTDTVLHALLIKNVPATREVLGSLPNVFSALCLNAKGLETFVKYAPFERLFKVLLSPMYLSAMRRRRSSDPVGDTASNLGNAMDELMRHQPTLKQPAIRAIIELLNSLVQLGSDFDYVCWKPQKGSTADPSQSNLRVSRPNEGGSSDEEDDDEEETSTSSHPQRYDLAAVDPSAISAEKTPIALVDYILNVMKFVDAILSNNSTDDHCREFVNQGGLIPLLTIYAVPNLPVDYPTTHAPQAIAAVCKSIVNLAQEQEVIREGLGQLLQVLEVLKPLYFRRDKDKHPGSILLHELTTAPSLDMAFTNPSATPLLHAIAAVHGYIIMFVHVCRTSQLEVRTLSLTQWGSQLGILILNLLSQLYTALVWESTILLALCCQESPFGISKEDVDKLCPFEKHLAELEAMEVDLTASNEGTTTDAESSGPSTSKQNKRGLSTSLQLKYIKPLLGVSSRLGRGLAEMFGLLVKLCVGFPVRSRRGNNTTTPVVPTPSAQAVAATLATLLSRGLNCEELPCAPAPKFKLTFLICSVGFTAPMLFDDKKCPYHLMLQKFVNLGGQSAFFAAFRWALSGGDKYSLKVGLEQPDLPETTGEFLHAWLMLLEKMVNPKAILESSHMLPSKPSLNNKTFDPIQYLKEIHKLAFTHVSYLWGRKPLKTYGSQMTETMLIIFRHILRGEKIIEERGSKEPEGSSAGMAATVNRRAARTSSDINMNELAQLMEMGFSRDNCFEALMLTSNVEQATDYLLSNFTPDQSDESSRPQQVDDFEPLSKENLDEFTKGALDVCLDILEVLPDTIYRVCELLISIMRRNGEKFTNDLLTSITASIYEKVNVLNSAVNMIEEALNESSDIDGEIACQPLFTSKQALKATSLIHLYMLLFHEIRVSCALIAHVSGMIPPLLRLISNVTNIIGVFPSVGTPKWMAPSLLLIDLMEKVVSVTQRKIDMHNVTIPTWCWFDLTSGKWCPYMISNNKLINESYWRGDKMLRITSGRRRYTITFQLMIQTNEDSGKQRPIMMTLKHPESDEPGSSTDPKSPLMQVTRFGFRHMEMLEPCFTYEVPVQDRFYNEGTSDFFHRRNDIEQISGLTPASTTYLMRACVNMIAIPVEPDTLHAAMQLCVRFSRDYENARLIAKMGIVNILLRLTQGSTFNGFTALATILIRHILEEPATLSFAMQKVLRTKLLASIPPYYRELHYLLRELGPAICRDQETFKYVAKHLMRVDISLLNKRGESEDYRCLMKAIRARPSFKTPPIDAVARQAIIDLLNDLVIDQEEESDNKDRSAGESSEQVNTDEQVAPSNNNGDGDGAQSSIPLPRQFNTRQNASRQRRLSPVMPTLVPHEELPYRLPTEPEAIDVDSLSPLNLPMYMTATAPTQPSAPQKNVNHPAESSQEKKKYTLKKSSILKILADAVRSFPTVATVITEHVFHPHQNENLTEDTTAIAFILDHMMSRDNLQSELERPNMARMLIAALASCNHSREAQSTLVVEVKASFARAMAKPESTKKHMQIQDLASIVTIMIEHCPPVPFTDAQLSTALKINQISENKMVPCLISKGIVSDLARISHHLDLSSPKMPQTVNAVLKPLEALSRIVNQSFGSSSAKSKKKPVTSTPAPTSDDSGNNQIEANTSDVTHNEGEETIEDTENNEEPSDPSIIIPTDAPLVRRNNEIEEGALAHVRDMIRLSNEPSRRLDFSSTLTTGFPARFQQVLDNNQASPGSSSDDSDSNSSNDVRNNLDNAETDIDLQEEDDDDNDTNNDENGDDTNNIFDDGALELYSDTGVLRLPLLGPGSEDFLMIEYSEPESRPWSSNSSFPMPFNIFEDPSNLSVDNSALSRVPSHHPLLMTRPSSDASPSLMRQRLTRPRSYRYLHMNRSTATPMFLQRLMSEQSFLPSANISVTDGISSFTSASNGNTRFVIMDNGYGVLTNAEDGQINFVDQSGYLMGPSLAATLSNIPVSMHWWVEESKLLDGDSQADAAVALSYDILPLFEKVKAEEVAELNEKREKEDEEEMKKRMAIGLESRPPTRPSPSRRIVMLNSHDVPRATENLAGSIVESVLHPRSNSTQPTQQFPSGPASPQSEPPEIASPTEDNSSNDVLMNTSENLACNDIPSALNLIPIEGGIIVDHTTEGNRSNDPLGLIPESEQYRVPTFEEYYVRPLVRPSLVLNENSPLATPLSPQYMTRNSGSQIIMPYDMEAVRQYMEDIGDRQPSSSAEASALAPTEQERSQSGSEDDQNPNDVAQNSQSFHWHDPIFDQTAELNTNDSIDNQRSNNAAIFDLSTDVQSIDNVANSSDEVSFSDQTTEINPHLHAGSDSTGNSSDEVSLSEQTTELNPHLHAESSGTCFDLPVDSTENPQDLIPFSERSTEINPHSSVVPYDEGNAELNPNHNSDLSEIMSYHDANTPYIEDDNTEISVNQQIEESDNMNFHDGESPVRSPPDVFPISELPTEMNPHLRSDARRRRRNAARSRDSPSEGPSNSGDGLRPVSGNNSSNGLLDEVPEDVDPSFLAALPEDIRTEVLTEHMRQQRVRQRVARHAGQTSASTIEVNADFLAALPDSIQEELMRHQREEQQRQAATATDPDEPVDPAAFFQELPHSLRISILSDIEESQISVLPPELAAEAQNLRREWEARNRQLMQERFISHVTNSTTALSSILRTSQARGLRRTTARYTLQNMAPSPRPNWMSNWAARFPVMAQSIVAESRSSSSTRSRVRQVLDYESISCLLVLLFVDDERLNTVRLHKIFKNVCNHPPTRDWVIRAILSIMEKSDESYRNATDSNRRITRSQANQSDSSLFQMISSSTKQRPVSSWLNISMDAALGCRATVFNVQKPPGRRTDRTISINAQAAPFVFKHALDILISLAKHFPICFLPSKVSTSQQSGTSGQKSSTKHRTENCNFWDFLIRLDTTSSSKKGKTNARMTTSQASSSQESDVFEASPFGQLLKMLGSPVVQRSHILTDRLLRILGIVSVGLYGSKQRLSETIQVSQKTMQDIGLAIDILTSNSCSEEGLEDATGLLLNIVVNIPRTRDKVLSLLLNGARNMATVVRKHIQALLKELKVQNKLQGSNENGENQPHESRNVAMKGILQNRFTNDTVVVSVSKKIKAGVDLQLPSMTPLISKSSSQAYFLRILKVIVQLRHSISKYEKKKRIPVEPEGEPNANPESSASGSTSRVGPEINRDVGGPSTTESDDENDEEMGSEKLDDALSPLSDFLILDDLWDMLSACLTELANTQDTHAVLVLQPAVEAFFLMHASGVERQPPNDSQNSASGVGVPNTRQVPEEITAPAPPPVSPLPNDPIAESQSSSSPNWPSSDSSATPSALVLHQRKFLKFAETHRTVLNQILRQCNTPLLEGPFAVLVNHTRVLDFDVKRRYFRGELDRADDGHRKEELAVHVRRNQVFEDSFRELHRRTPEDWKNRFYIVFEGEEGQDAGGLLREWYVIISREIFNPMYCLFTTSPGDRVTYTINPLSGFHTNHLSYFKFVGRVIAKAIYDNKLLECYFTRSFYKHILGISVKYTDMESEDYSFYKGLEYLMENDVANLGYELTFSTEVHEFGSTTIKDLIPDGRNLVVTEENKMDYIRLVCQMKMTSSIRQQIDSFLEGFYEIIPMRLISIFNEQELELLISGLPNVDIDDLKANTEYYKYQPNSIQIIWFWRILREFDQAERAKFLQFVTGTSKVPLQGFSALEGMNGIQKFQIHRDERSTDRLPSAHTCFNQLDLPVYETYTKLRNNLLKAIHECSEGFGFA